MFLSGITITGGTEGVIAMGMGDGTNLVQASNILNDYSYILLNGSEQDFEVLFRCATGLGPSESATNNGIGDVYYNDIPLPDGRCNGFIRPQGVTNVARFPGVYQASVCGALNTTTEGVYTCTLTNSNMMSQSVSIGAYLSGRSKLICVYTVSLVIRSFS